MKKKPLFKILKYIASLGFAFGILYLLFKNQDPIQLIEEIKKVDVKWVILSMIFGGWAIVNRGLRWIVLIDALGYKSSKSNAIAAVSVLYFTNLFIPRGGEITRCTSLNQAENIPVDKLFGTIIIERIIDFIFLCSLIFLTIILSSFLLTFSFDYISNLILNMSWYWLLLFLVYSYVMTIILSRFLCFSEQDKLALKHLLNKIKK